MMLKPVAVTGLIVLLIAVSVGGTLLTAYYSIDYATLFGNYIYFPVMAVLLIASIRFVVVFRPTVSFAALASLVIASVSWFVAELIWIVEELVLNIEPFPSPADYFYVLGYPFMMFFLISLRKEIKITGSTKIISAATSTAFLIPTFAAATVAYSDTPLYFLLASSYVVFDAALIWVVTSAALSVNNRKNNFWLVFFIGLVLLLVGDSMFIVTEISDTYYTGHPIELFFLCSYLVISLALFRQANLAKLGKIGSIQETFELHEGGRSVRLQIISTSVVSVMAVTLTILLGFGEFTKNEADSISAILVTAISISVMLAMVAYYLWKKLVNLKELQHNKDQKHDVGEEMGDLQNKILALEQKNKNISMLAMMAILAIVAVTSYFVADAFFDFVPENAQLMSGRYVVANLRGTEVSGTAFWQLAKDETIQVQIINAGFVSQEKLDAIKDAILSEQTIEIQNSDLGKEPPDLVETYYTGWKGALEKASESETEFYIPTGFEITESDKALGDISIILSRQKQPDRTISFTQSIADENQHQILKSFITIYDIDNLSAQEFAKITRHEFGHALGLNHLGNTNNDIHEENSYVSACDVVNMVSVYDEKPSVFSCN